MLSDSDNSTDLPILLINGTAPTPKFSFDDWFNDFWPLFNAILSVLQIVGFSLNVFHFSILTRKEMRGNIVYRMMIAICFCDMTSQILSFTSWSPFLIRSPKTVEEECYSSQNYFDVMTDYVIVPILDVFQRTSSWLAVFMALFRTISVKFPLSSSLQKLSRPSVAITTLVGMLVVSAVWVYIVVARFYVEEVHVEKNCIGGLVQLDEPRYSRLLQNGTENVHHTILMFYGLFKAFPSLIDLTIAIVLVFELRKTKLRRKNLMKSDSDNSDNTTKLILFMTTIFFLLEVPNGASHMFVSFADKENTLYNPMLYLLVVSEILPVINSSTHIFVCYFISSQYKDTAQRMVGVKKENLVVVMGKTSDGTAS